jgi:hypothetical protein
VRSRGAGGEGRPSRDLIEAGLSEPAGWRARLWRLCLRRLVQGAPSAEAGDHLDGLIAIGEGDCSRQIRAGNVDLGPAAALPAQRWIGAASVNAPILAGAIGARWRKGGAAELPMPHEVSSQNDARAGVGRGRMPRMTMAPPQMGHRSALCGARVSSNCSTGGSASDPLSSWRQNASLAMAVGEEAIMPDAVEPVRQGVEQEAADELVGLKRHDLRFAVMSIILPAEGDRGASHAEEAGVSDGDAMGVAGEIGQHLS